MRIYFAASIRGGRDDAAIYRQLIGELQQYGTVLTEHIAHPDDVERGMTDEEIYGRDMDWLTEADVVVAEVSTPSLGVGYELARAESLGKRVLCLFRPSSEGSLSAMISGSRLLTVAEYETIREASLAIREFLNPA
ncbi:MAG: nucleoside 2-deoxyribosyltransferase [Acidimicrobiia bacterium]|nr:nucleoside 2-deoxyribosyltransferase [Acidimicrobiia bacterium]